VELTEALPLVPRGHRVVRKRSAHVVKAPRYEVATLLNSQISELLHADVVFFAVLLLLLLTPSAKKVVGTKLAGNDVPADDAAETAGTDPSTTSAEMVTIAVAGTVQPAGVTLPPAMSTVVEIPRSLRIKKAVMKKSSL
jgi:hypothetical protein